MKKKQRNNARNEIETWESIFSNWALKMEKSVIYISECYMMIMTMVLMMMVTFFQYDFTLIWCILIRGKYILIEIVFWNRCKNGSFAFERFGLVESIHKTINVSMHKHIRTENATIRINFVHLSNK